MIEWVILGAAALVWELVGLYTRHKQSQPDPWGSTTLTWLLVRIAEHHYVVRWLIAGAWLWLGFHFLIQHNILGL